MDPEIPPADSCVLRKLLDNKGASIPDKPFVVIDDDGQAAETWSYSETREKIRTIAGRLASLNVGRGESVLYLGQKARHALEIWFALNYIGAVYVPINVHYRGPILERLIDQSGARVIVTESHFLDRLAETPLSALERVVLVDDPSAGRVSGLETLFLADVAPTEIPSGDEIAAWDTQSIIFTSGTTGPSKGVLSSYCHLASVVEDPYDFLDPDDRYLCNLPLFHVGGMLPIYAMLVRGGTVILTQPFRTAAFWPTVCRTRATACTLLSGMANLLLKQPASPDDRDHALRIALVIPLQSDASALKRRFGSNVVTIYHMTEICAPLYSGLNPRTPGSCGRIRPGVSVRLADEHDREVPPGEVGELLVRAERPWAMSHGYLGNSEATATAWRNGWFHTGDAFRRNEEGEFVFVDRLKDVIRRRGENISSFELERIVCRHPSVQDAAALAVSDGYGEDEVLVVVEKKPGEAVEPGELMEFLTPLLPRFMLPRYLKFASTLPRTPTGKVQKAELRLETSTHQMWDSQQHPRAFAHPH
jgi:crotonobetaine/carnitine-CoA ligase